MRPLGAALARAVQELQSRPEQVDPTPPAPARKRRGKPVQQTLGVWKLNARQGDVAVPELIVRSRPLSPSQRELVRRAGTYLSIQQQMTRRRHAADHE